MVMAFYYGKYELHAGQSHYPPDLLYLTGSLLSAWAFLEMSILDVAVSSVGGPKSSGAQVLLAVNSVRKRTEVAQKALLNHSTGIEHEIISRLLNAAQDARGLRNLIAHGVLVKVKNPKPDEIVFFNPEPNNERLEDPSEKELPIPLSSRGTFHHVTRENLEKSILDTSLIRDGIMGMAVHLMMPGDLKQTGFDERLQTVFSHLRIPHP